MRDGLTKGWLDVKLGEITTKPQYGWTCSASQNGNVKLLRTTDISKGSIEWNNVPFCVKNPDDIAKYLIEENDILISRAGSIRISYRIKEKDLQYDTVFASYLIRFKPLIIASYIEYFFKSHLYWDFIIGSKAGIAIPNVNASKLKDLPVPLPPFNEQKRIAAKLDTIMPKIEAVNARLDRIPQIIKRFRQSVLTAAVTGKLTEQWREEHPGILESKVDNTSALHDIYLPNSWEACTLGALSTYVTSGSRGWTKYYSERGSIFIRAQNIKTDELILDDVAFVQLPEKVEGRRTKVEKGDILITITGANVTKTALARKFLENAYVNQHVALVRLNEVDFGSYLHLWLIAPNAGRRQLAFFIMGIRKS